MRVVVVGGTGFVGHQVVRALRRGGHSAVAVSRSPRAGMTSRCADITHPDGLNEVLSDAEAVVHCASYLGANTCEQERVNVEGTRNVLRAAHARGQRVVYLSAAAVYGGVLPNGAPEGYIPIRPGSALARSRAAADAAVINAGGVVVRPNLVTGAGDRRTVPVILTGMTKLGGWIGDHTARVSVIDVTTLGELLADLATTSTPVPAVLHAAFPQPVPIRELLTPVYQTAQIPPPNTSIALTDATPLLPRLGASSRQAAMIAADNWYNSDRIWTITSRIPNPERLRDPDTLNSYAAHLLTVTGHPASPGVLPAYAPARA